MDVGGGRERKRKEERRAEGKEGGREAMKGKTIQLCVRRWASVLLLHWGEKNGSNGNKVEKENPMN